MKELRESVEDRKNGIAYTLIRNFELDYIVLEVFNGFNGTDKIGHIFLDTENKSIEDRKNGIIYALTGGLINMIDYES